MDNRPLDARLASKLVLPLQNTRVTPNHLTTVRLVFGILAAAGLATGEYLWSNFGAACFVISNFLDHADGELARISGKSSKSGHKFDLACDAIVNILLFIGIGIGMVNTVPGYWSVLMGLVSGTAIAGIFHMRNEIEKTIGKEKARQPHAGMFEAEDVLYLLPLITLMEWLLPFLYLAVIGAPVYALLVWREYNSVK